jgi:O-antigen ligase
VLGSGAGTFGRYWLQSGPVGRFGGALDAHSLYLETLAELGPIGLVLLAGFLLYPLRRVVEARHLPGVPAATGAAVAFLVHAGLDWDWELPAVTVAGLACLAAVLLAGRHERTEPLPRLARTAGLACALALGLAAVAGTVSGAQPSAAVDDEAPPSGASSHVVR